ncbi:glycine betaine ABC transporter substrate-binding protein OsmF [Pseudomonas sp. UBA2684]|uniref:glycine betaine ABC transporter substrate-binding protein OsmF n=1 Tax=Pseudomonas sp. UBA2684 TaxID=1947311 RepID=UPI0025EB1E3A|nr:ABC transporter substrate-binding protein [Pseudomonas sp. UBA2684]|tara:strand:+ start:12042 stop:12965 length:924 start_codon:yes stop_codon:yes gene_type:complete
MSLVNNTIVRLLSLLAFCVAVSLPAQAEDRVVVASKIDTEGAVLGQLIYQALQRGGVPVEDRIQLGGTSIVRKALLAGEVDIYPEYTGNGAFFFEQADSALWKDAEAGYAEVKRRDLEANQLVWLQPANANNTWAMSVRGDLARAQGLKTLDDLAQYLKAGGAFKFAASAEFVESPSALPAFQQAYGFTLTAEQLLILSGGNTAATLRAAALQTSGVNAAMSYGTDGGLSALDLQVLEDTRGVQPVYQPAPVVRAETLQAYPQIGELLEPIFAELDLQTLQHLNAQVAVEGADAAQVAADFLDSLGD